MTITVIIPTYQRPKYLRGCLRSICAQTRRPDQVFVIVRDGDAESLFAIKDLIARQPFLIRIDVVVVHEAGFLPPLQAGVDAAQSDIVAFIDDDAEALPDWLQRLERHYADQRVAGVGGREIKTLNGVEKKYKPAKVFGKVFWYGRCEGNLYRDGFSEDATEVDGLVGCNMSYRASVLKKVQLDWRMGNGTAYQYELDLGLQIKKLGLKLLYDPTAKVKHFEAAARSGGADQNLTDEQAYWMSFNTEYVVFKHSNFFQRCAVIIYQIFIGQSLRWGFLSLAWYWIRFKKMPKVFRVSLAGRIAGIKTALFQKPIYLKPSKASFHKDYKEVSDRPEVLPRFENKELAPPPVLTPE